MCKCILYWSCISKHVRSFLLKRFMIFFSIRQRLIDCNVLWNILTYVCNQLKQQIAFTIHTKDKYRTALYLFAWVVPRAEKHPASDLCGTKRGDRCELLFTRKNGNIMRNVLNRMELNSHFIFNGVVKISQICACAIHLDVKSMSVIGASYLIVSQGTIFKFVDFCCILERDNRGSNSD